MICLQRVEIAGDRILHRFLVLVTELLDPVIRSHECRVDGRLTRGIGIDLTPHVMAFGTHAYQQLLHQLPSRIVEMIDDGRCFQGDRICENFLRTVCLCGCRTWGVPQMHGRRSTVPCADALHLVHLARGRTREITNGRSDAECTLAQAFVNDRKHSVAVFELEYIIGPGNSRTPALDHGVCRVQQVLVRKFLGHLHTGEFVT